MPNAKYPLELVEADLNDKDCWGPAVDGCSYVFQVASHAPPDCEHEGSVDEDNLIARELDGVVNVLTACAESGSVVKRVVMTSSVAAISSGMGGNPGRPDDYEYTEEDWSDEESCPPFEKSKLKAERAAWDFVNKLENKKFEFVVVNPSFIQGPLLSAASGAISIALAKLLLERLMPAVPNVCVGIVDVRDVVAGEMAAMFSSDAAGKRFILNGGTTNFRDFAVTVQEEFQTQGYNVPTSAIPKFILWGLKFFVPAIKAAYPGINKSTSWSNERMKSELGVTPRPIKQAIIDTCYSIIELGLVAKAPGYLGPPELRNN